MVDRHVVMFQQQEQQKEKGCQRRESDRDNEVMLRMEVVVH